MRCDIVPACTCEPPMCMMLMLPLPVATTSSIFRKNAGRFDTSGSKASVSLSYRTKASVSTGTGVCAAAVSDSIVQIAIII